MRTEEQIVYDINSNRANYQANQTQWSANQLQQHNATMRQLYAELQALYTQGVTIPETIVGGIFGMKKNDNLYELGCDVLVPNGLTDIRVNISAQGRTIEECKNNWNAKFN